MSTSGTVTFQETLNEIIRDALEDAGILGVEQNLDNALAQKAKKKLNMLVKHWQKQKIYLWTKVEASVFLVPGQVSYDIGLTGDPATNTPNQTTISASEALGQTVLSITSNANMTNGDQIGIVLDSGSLQWTIIVSSTSTTVTVNNALTDSASAGNFVFNYTANIDRPLFLMSAFLRNSSGLDREVTVFSKDQYDAIPNKADQMSDILQCYYDAKRDTLGKLFVWPTSDSASSVLHITYARPLQDFDSSTDNADFPVEWILCLTTHLAALMCPAAGKDTKKQGLQMDADRYLNDMLSFSHDSPSISITPDMDY